MWIGRNLVTAVVIAVALGRVAVAEDLGGPLEPADTSSPRATLETFVDSCNTIYDAIQNTEISGRHRKAKQFAAVVKRILRCLDLSETPEYLRESKGRETAVMLKEVLDRITLPPYDQIPDAKAVQATKETAALERWKIPDTDITIAKIEEGPRRGEWLFTSDTVDRADEFYDHVKGLPYRTTGPAVTKGFYSWFLSEPGSAWLANLVSRLPDWMRSRWQGQAVWQWIGLTVAAIVGLAVMLLAYRVGRWSAARMRKTGVLRYCLTLLFPIAAMAVPLVVRDFIAQQLAVSGTTLSVVKFTANMVFLVAILVVVVGAGNRITELLIASPRIHPKGLDAQFIRIVCRVLSLIVAIILFLEGGKYLGIPLTTLLAGAGVGGLAVALSAQDMLKNLFGSVMVILDKPYCVGERIVVKGFDGVVEEIGLRSTKIRLLTGHVATIPNDDMARSHVENIGRRPHIRRIADIGLTLETPPDKVERAVEIIREIMKDHEGMDPEFPPRVYHNDIQRDALNLRLIYWYHPPDYWDFLAMSEKVNLRIQREFEAEGIELARPPLLPPGPGGAKPAG